MRPLDTDLAAHEAQMRAYRRLTPDARSRQALALSEDVRRIALDGIAARHPEYDEGQRRRALVRLMFGDSVARAVWPGEAPVAP